VTTNVHPRSAIRTLTDETCLELLRAEAVGRVGFVSDEGVEILPVGYRVGAGPRLFISTQLWGKVGQLAETAERCCFEVDHHSSTGRDGWSVLMQGALSRLDPAGAAAFAQLDRRLESWPGYPGARPVQFVPESFSGRSVGRPA